VAAATALPVLGIDLLRPSPASAGTARTLVVLSLRGGLDGLSAVIPVAEPRYFDLRPTVAVPESAAIPLDERFALHPALAPLFDLWIDGDMAAVHAVGIGQPTRSHFEAQALLDHGSLEAIESGWLARYAEAAGAASSALALGPGPHRSLRGTSAAFVDDLERFSVDLPVTVGDTNGLLAGLYPRGSVIGEAAASAVEAMAWLETARAQPPASGFPETPLGHRCGELARILASGIRPPVVSLDATGYDTHDRMGYATGGTMHRLLDELARCLAALRAHTGAAWNDLTLVAVSEFGRRVAENGSRGTDHGYGGVALVVGGGLGGGRVAGRWPGLDDASLIRGDLAVTTDVRDVFAEVITARHRAGDLAHVFPGHTPRSVGIFS
jgi:uncharacterized protein (DUF1501 family)